VSQHSSTNQVFVQLSFFTCCFVLKRQNGAPASHTLAQVVRQVAPPQPFPNFHAICVPTLGAVRFFGGFFFCELRV
jgi:hypothetical protein